MSSLRTWVEVLSVSCDFETGNSKVSDVEDLSWLAVIKHYLGISHKREESLIWIGIVPAEDM